MSMPSSPTDFYVRFHAPADSLYEGGTYKVHVTLPVTYPYKSPSIGFCTPIFHPNVDEASGSVCLDVINQTWSPMFDLCNVFNVFLPQLLLYPNPADPLNGQAAALMMKDKDAYKVRVSEHVKKHAMSKFSFDNGRGAQHDSDDDSESSENAQNSVDSTADTSADDSDKSRNTEDDDADYGEELMSDVDDAPSEAFDFEL